VAIDTAPIEKLTAKLPTVAVAVTVLVCAGSVNVTAAFPLPSVVATPVSSTPPPERIRKRTVIPASGTPAASNVCTPSGTVVPTPALDGGATATNSLVATGSALHFTGIPSFAPEFLRRVRADDPMKAKHLGRALEQIAEEGGAQVFKMFLGSDFIVGVVGSLQFEVLADRIRSEYDLPCHFEATSFEVARWVDAEDPKLIKRFADANRDNIAEDHSGATVFLARNEWQLNRAKQDYPALQFLQSQSDGLGIALQDTRDVLDPAMPQLRRLNGRSALLRHIDDVHLDLFFRNGFAKV